MQVGGESDEEGDGFGCFGVFIDVALIIIAYYSNNDQTSYGDSDPI